MSRPARIFPNLDNNLGQATVSPVENNAEVDNAWSCCGGAEFKSSGCLMMHAGKYVVTKERFGLVTKQKWSCCESSEASDPGCVKYHSGRPPLVS